MTYGELCETCPKLVTSGADGEYELEHLLVVNYTQNSFYFDKIEIRLEVISQYQSTRRLNTRLIKEWNGDAKALQTNAFASSFFSKFT